MSKKHKTLKDEIQQIKAFDNLEAEVFLNLVRTAEALATENDTLLRQFGLSRSQYNVLRILRGAGDLGLSGRDIVERMVTRDPDMTRILDGLEVKELVERARSEQDRRVIVATITSKGRELLDEIAEPLGRLHKTQLRHLSEQKLRRLIALLEEARHRD
jgi:DNA-binding MarR family transcriptional regulator